MASKIGDKVLSRRKELKMTQADLAKNICTQSQVSRIEKNEIMPSSDTLYQIACRLNVSMDYFFGVEPVNNTIRGKKICEDYLESKDFETLEVFVDAQLQTVLTEYEHRYLTWVKAVCAGYTKPDLRLAIKTLEDLLENPIKYQDYELEASIHNSLAIFYRKTKEADKAETQIRKARYIINENHLFNETAAKIYYQYATFLVSEEKYEECLDIADEGIEICIKYNILFLLDNLIYLACGSKQELDIISQRDRDLCAVGYGLAKMKNNTVLIDLYEQELKKYNLL
ncbi:helix-turn-helix domain-containing protein [Macrococcus hajekii]|uniref:Helix-turn-helix domain-containing protein n=1 Tax=Macrococcus hajekii TaxID=198482 RepID=A0A4R6BLE9_9STAP|nr:helix-turn-helix transcriptional regulator [Macrococcus hajekii]TDM02613.1 helix-turn-helix domain-containing protein [Macrococcus hajekii]GGB02467.1 transcriptional regulator [Macrococcus hajekii]